MIVDLGRRCFGRETVSAIEVIDAWVWDVVGGRRWFGRETVSVEAVDAMMCVVWSLEDIESEVVNE